ncbi:MAG: hypothetical protein ACI4LA_06660 [Emergencia sp.]
MPLMILGFVFAVGLFIFYLLSTRSESDTDDKPADSDLKQEENVIFLPDDVERIKEKHRKKR